MIQDIFPARMDNSFQDRQPSPTDPLLVFQEGRAVVKAREGRLVFPTCAEMDSPRCVYAFSMGSRSFFLARSEQAAPEAYEQYTLSELRGMKLSGNQDIFAVYTGFHLWNWYRTNRFCGRCGKETQEAHDERAMQCPACGNRIYPRINPAVIVGVTDGDRLLITRYKRGFRHNALIAGFVEIGETVEQCVEREVMEEVGLRVRNIRYFKSQPWGIASDLLMGFYCDVDGERTIHMQEDELGYAQWVSRPEIILQPSNHSLTNEMMRLFKERKEQ